jgi:hypothetical protein
VFETAISFDPGAMLADVITFAIPEGEEGRVHA